MTQNTPGGALRVAAFFSGFVFVVSLVFLPRASAASTTPTLGCRFEAGFAELARIAEDATLDDRARLIAELNARKQLLGETIRCGTEELQATRTTLTGLTLADKALSATSKYLANRLTEASSFYERQTSRIATLGIRGTKDVAQELYDWRAGTYLPLADFINNFVIWNNNQDLFQATKDRFQSVHATITFLKLENDVNITTLLGEADAHFADAEKSNRDAELALQNLSEPEVSLALIKKSLEELNATYKSFFSITEEIGKKILPLR